MFYFILVSILATAFSTSPLILNDGCPERDYNQETHSKKGCFRDWTEDEFRDWVFSMCTCNHTDSPQRPTSTPSDCTGSGCGTAQPVDYQSSSPAGNPPSSSPTFITTVVDTIINRLTQSPTATPSQSPSSFPSNIPSSTPSAIPSSLPSVVPSGSPSDVPSDYPTWISTSTVRCPSAKKVNNSS